MKKIHWRPILNFNLYWVSSDGRVRTFRSRPRVVRPATDKGYKKVHLTNENKDITPRVHRLVGEAFLRPKEGMPEVNHKDLDKGNNNLSNLEWCTRLSNMDHFFKNGERWDRKGEDHGMSKLSESDVLEIRSMKGKQSYQKTMKMYGIGISQYYRIVNNQSWTHLCSPTAKSPATTATE